MELFLSGLADWNDELRRLLDDRIQEISVPEHPGGKPDRSGYRRFSSV
jgi:hypothetical protein